MIRQSVHYINIRDLSLITYNHHSHILSQQKASTQRAPPSYARQINLQKTHHSVTVINRQNLPLWDSYPKDIAPYRIWPS